LVFQVCCIPAPLVRFPAANYQNGGAGNWNVERKLQIPAPLVYRVLLDPLNLFRGKAVICALTIWRITTIREAQAFCCKTNRCAGTVSRS